MNLKMPSPKAGAFSTILRALAVRYVPLYF